MLQASFDLVAMSMSTQDALHESWVGGIEDRLCGREQAKAWALREVWREEGKSSHGLLTFVASRVRKTHRHRHLLVCGRRLLSSCLQFASPLLEAPCF